MFTTARVGTKRRLFSTKRRSRSEHTCSAPSTKDVASTYNNMGNVYDSQGQYETALEFYQKNLDITIRVFGHQHNAVATAKYNIAEVKKGGGRKRLHLVRGKN